MDDILLSQHLRARGLDKAEIDRLLRDGGLERLRRGAFARPGATDELAEERHRRLILSSKPYLDDAAVVSHGSAAVLLGLPAWPEAIRRVHVTRNRKYGGQRRRLVHVHVATIGHPDVTTVDGIQLTSMARTVLDLGRTLPLLQSVPVGDQALRTGLTAEELQFGLLGMTHWPGVRRARLMCDLLDARSESVGESASRVRIVEQGLPSPELQAQIFDAQGRMIGRCDFGWRRQRTVGEFDGKVKYGRALNPGQSIDEVLYAEKLREDALRDAGWQVVRWGWSELSRPEVIRDRLLRAFARGSAASTAWPG